MALQYRISEIFDKKALNNQKHVVYLHLTFNSNPHENKSKRKVKRVTKKRF